MSDERTVQLERQLAIMRKAARLDIAARLLAELCGDSDNRSNWPGMRAKALEQAELLIAENEARP